MNRLVNRILAICSMLVISMNANAQTQVGLPLCTGYDATLLYFISGQIYQYDPSLPLSATNPWQNTVTNSPGGDGMAVGKNIYAATPLMTFYLSGTAGNNYYWYNGTTWVNSTYNPGNGAAVNPTASGNYLYNLVGASGEIYRNTSVGNGTLFLTIAGFNGNGPYDLQGDCAGNVYILDNVSQYMREYNSSAALVQTWTLSGNPSGSTAGGGFGIIGDTIYFHVNTSPGFWKGYFSGSTIICSSISSALSPSPYDFGTCPIGGIGQGAHDTSFYCGHGPGVIISHPGNGPFTWSVASGPAVIFGGGSSVTVTSVATSLITVVDSAGCGGFNIDTTLLFVPTASLYHGFPNTLVACGNFLDTINGSLTNTTSWLTYNISWTPTLSIVSGANTMQPVVSPTVTTTYHVLVSTPPNEGNCTWTDSVKITAVDTTVKAKYTYLVHYGCHGDTVLFTNSSTRAVNYKWIFGDGTLDTATNPVHIFKNQGTYVVRLYASNPTCNDSSIQTVNLSHPLKASFTTDKDSICQGGKIAFTNTSVTTVQNGINPNYYWSYSDGLSDITKNTVHTFTLPGIYKIMLAVKDFVPCYDTTYHLIEVDSLPYMNFTLSDSVFCEGKGIVFDAIYLHEGLTSLEWYFGDGEGNFIYNRNPVTHAYDAVGVFTIKLTNKYRFCNDTSFTNTIRVKNYPAINIGRDTSICPNSSTPVTAYDYINAGNAAASWLWNTGATTPGISIFSPGIYSATVTIDGCSTTDSMEVFKDCYIDIPNVFTPNGDGVNDYFFPRQLLTSGATAFSMQIFDRWGMLLFETTNTNGRGWDGKFNDIPQPEGVYIYLINVSFKNGITEKFRGNVTLLR